MAGGMLRARGDETTTSSQRRPARRTEGRSLAFLFVHRCSSNGRSAWVELSLRSIRTPRATARGTRRDDDDDADDDDADDADDDAACDDAEECNDATIYVRDGGASVRSTARRARARERRRERPRGAAHRRTAVETLMDRGRRRGARARATTYR